MGKDKLKLGDGILAQTSSDNTYKPIDFNNPQEVKEAQDRLIEYFKEEDERRRNSKPQQYAQLLLSYEDELFKIMYRSDDIMWIGGIDVFNAIEERAKKLGL